MFLRIPVKLPRWLLVLILLAPLITGGTVYFVSHAVLSVNIRPAPLRYTLMPQPVREPVCPGDTVSYTFEFDLRTEALPLTLTVERGVFSEEAGRFVVGSTEAVTYPYNRPAHIRRTSFYTLPLLTDSGEPFAPGAYYLEVGGESEGRATVGFSVAFSISDSCDD